jgi:hypothetical protein
LSRAGRRILLKQAMAAISKSGMDLRANPSDQSWAVIAATRTMYDILSGYGATRASQAAKWAHEFFETSLRKNPSEHKIECAKGCAHCCKVSVSAMAPEIFHVVNTLRAQHRQDFDAVRARIRAAEGLTHGVSPMDRGRRKLPCALLVDNMCSVYAARPGPCRGMASTSLKACLTVFGGGEAGIPTPSVWTALRDAHIQSLWAALSAAELPSEAYELNEAVTVALEQPDAEARWLKGEDVFRGVTRLRAETPGVAEHNRKIIAMLVAGALGKAPSTGSG